MASPRPSQPVAAYSGPSTRQVVKALAEGVAAEAQQQQPAAHAATRKRAASATKAAMRQLPPVPVFAGVVDAIQEAAEALQTGQHEALQEEDESTDDDDKYSDTLGEDGLYARRR